MGTMKDAAFTGDWLGSRDAYFRDGLDADPALVDCPIEGQRIYAAASHA